MRDQTNNAEWHGVAGRSVTDHEGLFSKACSHTSKILTRLTCLARQGMGSVAGMRQNWRSPTMATPRLARLAGSCHPLNTSLLVVVPAATCSCRELCFVSASASEYTC